MQHQKYFTMKLLPAAICAVSLQAIAADYNVSTAITGPVELNTNYDSVSVLASGSISGIAPQESALALDAIFGNVTNFGNLHGDLGDGISLHGTISGDLINNGRIEAAASWEGNSAIRLREGSRIEGSLVNEAEGILVSSSKEHSATLEVEEGAFAGDIINRGTITHSTGADSVGDAIGVYGTVRSIENTGTITTDDSAIQMQGRVENGIVNKGTISVTGGQAWGDGIGIAGSVSGGVSNEGSITFTPVSCDDDPHCIGGGMGLYGPATVAGGVSNSGTITTSGGLENAVDAGIIMMSVLDTDGLDMGSPTLTGDIHNSGDIVSDFSAIYVGGATVNGSIVNTAEGSLSGDYGILLSNHSVLTTPDGDPDDPLNIDGGKDLRIVETGLHRTVVSGDLINDGTITGRTEGAIAIEADVTIQGDIVNNGSLDSRNGSQYVGDGIGMYGTARSIANSGTILSDDTGIQIAGQVIGDISNEGLISIIGGEAWGDGIGVNDGNIGGTIRNDGELTISATSCVDDPFCLAGGVGIYGQSTVGGIVNTGTISTTVNGLENALGAGINLVSIQDATGASLGSPTLNGNIVNSGSIAGDPASLLESASMSGGAAIFLGGATVNGNIINTETGSLSGAHGILISTLAAEVGPVGPVDDLPPGSIIETDHLGMVEAGISPAVINGSIINNGTITGKYVDGITIDGNVTIRGDIINTGTIETLQTEDYGVGAIWFGADGDVGQADPIVAGATLTGAIINSGLLRAPTRTDGVITIDGAHQIGGVINMAGGVIENTTAGDAIWVDDAGSIGFVTNAGTIRGAIDFGAQGGVFNAVGGTNDAIYNASRINIRSTGEVGPTLSTFADADGFTYNGMIGVDAIGSVGGLGYGQLQVLGDADVRGASVDVMVSGEQFIEDGSSFTFLQADGILQSDITTATDNSAVLSFGITRSGNALTATAHRTALGDITAASSAVGGTAGANTLQVAGALDSVVAAIGSQNVDQNSGLGNVINRLSALGTVDEVAAAVKSLQPEVVGSTVVAASAAGNAAAGTISNRQASLRGYGQTGMVAGDEVAANGFWMQLYHSSADQDMRNGIDGYDVKTDGLALGADTPIGEHIDLGFALTYGQTDVDTDRDSRIEIDSYQLSLYASYNPGRWFTDGIVSYARNQYETERTLFTGATAKADYDGDQYDVRARAGYPFAINDRLQLTPIFSAQYTHLDEEKYREHGANNAGLIIDSDTNEAFVVGASLEAAYTFTSANQVNWVPSITLGVYKDLIGDEVEQQSGFIGLPSASFSTRGADVATTSYLAGIGLEVFGQSNLSVTLSYDYLSKDDYQGQSASATLRYAF